MGIFEAIFHPVRYVLGRSMRGVFDEEVRANPVVINAEAQSNDVGARKRKGKATGEGSSQQGFTPQYVVRLRPPRNDVEAQRLYNHIRTLAFYLDAIPVLGRRLPFNVGLDSIVGLIPFVGDWIGLMLALYAVFLCALFGLPVQLLAMMVVNVVVDCSLGLIPIVGDALDVAFKANLRNLRMLEDHLIKNEGRCNAGSFSLHVPPSNVFMPPKGSATFAAPARASQRAGASSSSSSSNILPDGSVKDRWATTRGGSRPDVRQDFRNGTIDRSGADDSRQSMTDRRSVSVVPNEIFTTMRYERDGITLAEACASLPGISTGHAQWHRRHSILLFKRHKDRLLEAVSRMRSTFPHEWSACAIDIEQVDVEVNAHLRQHGQGDGSGRRVRVGVSRDGRFHVNSAPLPPAVSNDVKSVRIDPFALPTELLSDHDRVLLECKTGERSTYDDARARVNATLGVPSFNGRQSDHSACFDVLMNAQASQRADALLTESSIANIVVAYHDGRVVTPRTTHALPLLRGVMRQELLDLGVVHEEDVGVRDLVKASLRGEAKVFLCNALRGIIPVQIEEY